MREDAFKAPPRSRSRTSVLLEKILPLLIYLAAIAEAEWVVTYSDPNMGVIIYAIIFAALLLHSYLEKGLAAQRLLLSLSLAPLMRIIDVMIPMVSFYQLYRYILISIPLLIATVVVMRVLKMEAGEVRFTLRHIPAQVGVALAGIPLGLAGYLILRPQTLIIGLTWWDMVLPGLIFILCTGFVQELIFRGVMQRASEQVLGKWGILYISALFGILSMGQFSALNMLFMFGVALFFSWVVKRTGSLLGVMLAHGIMNVGLYLVVPSLM